MLLLFLLLPTALLLMLRGLEQYERMIDAPPRKMRSAPADDVSVTLALASGEAARDVA